MADIQERYGTESEKFSDKNKIQSIWNRAPSAYEGEKIIELPYSQYLSVGASVGVSAPQQYKINSIYDPDLTGSGNQPLGRDTWAGIYNYYKVLESHVTISVTEITDDSTGAVTANQQPSLVGWMADLVAAPPSSLNTWLMTSMASGNNETQKFCTPVISDIINGRGSKTNVFTYKWDASQFDTSIIDNAKNEWTPVTTDPANINYFSLIYFNPNGAATTRTIVIKTDIRYLVAFKQVNRTLLNTVN